MKKNRLKANLSLWLSALCLMVTFQSCNKEKDLAEPSTIAASSSQQDCFFRAPSEPCKTVPLVANNNVVGNVGVSTVNGNVLVTYTITAPRLYLSEIHLDAFTSMAQMQADRKVRNGCALPDNFAFNNYWLSLFRLTSYTVIIPKYYVDRLGSDCFFIASHAELTSGATMWGGLCRPISTGISLDGAKRFSGTSGSVYFEFCKSECSKGIDFTYAWEDINASANDLDYNDLVVQSDVIKSSNELKIDFSLTARGAGYDHKFKFKIPMAGITEIFGASSYTNDGTYYYITVFESTKSALPASPGGIFANTESTQTDCTPTATKSITLTLNNSFVYNAARPYEPFITVYVGGDAIAATGYSYDLYVYSISNRDTWTSTAGKVYPNGIVIPGDWRWPLENVPVTTPYPSFTSLSDGFTTTWANNLAVPAQTFDKNTCN